MALVLEFIDFIVPIDKIRLKYPGGWVGCLRDHSALIGGRVWYDDCLFRDGAMNPMDMELLVGRWTSIGFERFEEKSGIRHWKEMCVVESMFGGPTHPCDWLEFDRSRRIAFLKNTNPGPIIGRNEVRHDAGEEPN